ncbi:MAG TPA: DNA polymerase IV, partial [Devosia sp.]|nr:DNA polymerase IV [Devosia sp.]
MDSLAHLCRDCFETFCSISAQKHCPGCGSSRLLAHAELDELSMAHIDCDAFYASVEKRDNPDLIDKPLIIGGGRRGVVATCCYIARMSGVRSAMPMFTARKKCPDAIIIKPQMEKYARVSKQIRKLMNALSPAVEPLSIDEAFVDLAGTQALHKANPAKVLARFAKTVENEIGVSVSIGLSHNKFLAKLASDLEKPRGMTLIGQKETMTLLAPMPISIIYGVGKVFAEKLRRDGFVTIGQLQSRDPDHL